MDALEVTDEERARRGVDLRVGVDLRADAAAGMIIEDVTDQRNLAGENRETNDANCLRHGTRRRGPNVKRPRRESETREAAKGNVCNVCERDEK